MADRAEALDGQAGAAERELEKRAEREAAGGEGGKPFDLDALREEMARVRRRAADLEEEIRRREAR